MANIAKPSIGNSVSYKIGGKNYSVKDVSTWNAKTGTDIHRESADSVQSQTHGYHGTKAYDTNKQGIQNIVSSTPGRVESIKTGTNSQTTANSSISTLIQNKNVGTGNIKTQSSISDEATRNVQNQTNSYHKTGAYDTSRSRIQSEANQTPRTVEEIKTGGTPVPGNGVSGSAYKPQPGTASIVNNSPYVATGNVKTQSSISNEATRNVQNQTNSYHKTGAYSSQQSIYERADNSPVNMSGLRTGSARITQGINTSFFDVVNSTRNKTFSVSSIAGKAEATLVTQEDFATQTAGMVIGAGIAATEIMHVTQTAVDVAPKVAKGAANGIYNIGKGVYQIGLTSGLAIAAISRTVTFVQAGQFKAISHESIQMLKAQAIATGLNRTAVSQGIIHAVNGIQTRLGNGIKTAKQVGNQIHTGYNTVKKGIRIVRGVANKTISKKVAAEKINKYANKIIHASATGIRTGVAKGIKTGGRIGTVIIVKGVTKGVPFVTKKAIRGMRKMYHPVVSVLHSSDDWTLQGVSNIATASEIGLKTAITGVKATGYAVRTAVKGGTTTGKTAIAAGRFIKNNGLKAAWYTGRKKVAQTAIEAGKGIVTALIDVAKAIGKKAIIPLIIIIIVVMGFNGAVMVPVTGVSSIFSSMFSTKDSKIDYDVSEYLNGIVPSLVTQFQNDLADQMADSWNNYNIVRFYSNSGSTDIVDPTLGGVKSVFPSTEEVVSTMQPVFNAVLLMDFELEPTEAEAENLAKDIFSRLFTIDKETSTEYCGQDLKTGKGTPRTAHKCGSIHALSDCPNKKTGKHSSYKCDDCCYYDCPGHDPEKDDEEDNGGKSYCDGCEQKCSGYSYCKSHKVISYSLSVDGIYRLEAEYFLNPIEELTSKTNRSEKENAKLQELKDYYEIFQEMMSQVSTSYSGGTTMADLSGVKFVNGTRKENQDVIDLALSQVGQSGGQPYWSYYGFKSRVSWCACFVHWCMRHTPSASSKYPQTANNAYCQTVANNFKEIGQWGDRNYTDLVAGDTIFFDWEGDGHTDHIGLVIGTDGKMVYTVEGNSKDSVRLKSYPIGSHVIYGYGLMNY